MGLHYRRLLLLSEQGTLFSIKAFALYGFFVNARIGHRHGTFSAQPHRMFRIAGTIDRHVDNMCPLFALYWIFTSSRLPCHRQRRCDSFVPGILDAPRLPFPHKSSIRPLDLKRSLHFLAFSLTEEACHLSPQGATPNSLVRFRAEQDERTVTNIRDMKI